MKVCAYVHVRSEDGAQTAVLAPGDTVPEWAEVTNPEALESEQEDSAPSAPVTPVEETPAPAAPVEETPAPAAPAAPKRAPRKAKPAQATPTA